MMFYSTYIVLIITLIMFCKNLYGEKIVVVRGDGNYAPYEIYENDRLSGIHPEILEEVFGNLGIQYEYRSYPWVRAVKMVMDGQVDAITFVGYNNERAKSLTYLEDNILTTMENCFFTLNKYKDLVEYNGKLSSFSPHKIIGISSYSYSQEWVDYKYRFFDGGAKNETQVIDKLLIGRAKFAIGGKTTIKYLLQKKDVLDDIYFFEKPYNTINLYIAFSKKSGKEELAKRFAEEWQKFKQSDKYKEILDRYYQSPTSK